MGTLLIIDDSLSVREELVEILTAEGEFNVFLQAQDGASGLRILSDPGQSVDVVCCDLNMPLMDGYQFLRMARANPGLMSIPIVMVTSESEESEVLKAFELGANDFISKPFVPSILRARLKNMLHIKHLQDLLKAQRGMMEEMATKDALTGIANQRSFWLSLEDEFNRSRRYGEAMSLLMADLDHFKLVNDTHGHPFGDAVLRQTAAIMLEVMRKVDIVARYGGEEFAVIMPHTDLEGAVKAGERVRAAVQACTFEGPGSAARITVSIGVTSLTEGMDVDTHGLVKLADEALYRAKVGGRNRVEKSDAPVK